MSTCEEGRNLGAYSKEEKHNGERDENEWKLEPSESTDGCKKDDFDRECDEE